MSDVETASIWVPASKMAGMRQFYRSVLAPADYKEVEKTENGILMFGYFYVCSTSGKPEKVPPLWLKTLPYGGQVVSRTEIIIPSCACELNKTRPRNKKKKEKKRKRKKGEKLILTIGEAIKKHVDEFYKIALYVGLNKLLRIQILYSHLLNPGAGNKGAKE